MSAKDLKLIYWLISINCLASIFLAIALIVQQNTIKKLGKIAEMQIETSKIHTKNIRIISNFLEEFSRKLDSPQDTGPF